MEGKMYFEIERAERILKDLQKLIYSDIEPIESYKVKEGNHKDYYDIKIDDSNWEDYSIGNLWGGYDKHLWFRTKVTIPQRFSGKVVAFKMATGHEGETDMLNPQFLFYLDGNIMQGLDVNHREVIISDDAEGHREYNIAMLGYSGLNEGKSNLFTNLMVIDKHVEELYYNISVLLSCAKLLDNKDKNRVDLINIMDSALDMLDMRKPYSANFYNSIIEVNRFLEDNLYKEENNKKSPVVTALGHTHIDVAWLWTLSQTREKAARSFSTVLKLMEQYPDYKFMSSQPQLYEYIKEDHPELYEKIKERVKEGRWEVDGAMWLEPDCNLTSGESLVRQILFGTRFIKKEFNVDCKTLWLPDVFGYNGAIPQILKKSGIKYFSTSKMDWNMFSQFPNHTFMWRGIDGSEVFTHFITTSDHDKETGDKLTFNGRYNKTTYHGDINANQVLGTWTRYYNKNINDETILLFGYGDGGGGPTKEMLERYKRFKYGIPGYPAVNIDFQGNFFDRIYEKAKDNKKLPTWVGELYLECHRGTYTSIGKAKKNNRKCELLYQDGEMLSSFNMILGNEYPKEKLNKGWKTILLNQFHDILPGSSIKEVYDESNIQYADTIENGNEIVNNSLENIAKNIKLDAKSLIVFNTLSYDRDDIVEFDIPEDMGNIGLVDQNGCKISCQIIAGGRKAVFFASGVPSKGLKVYKMIEESVQKSHNEYISQDIMENRFFKIMFDDNKNIISMYDKINEREVLKKGEKANVIQAFDDRPMLFENWDIDIYYNNKMWEINEIKDIKVVENGPVRYCLMVERSFCDSTIVQYIYMYRDIPRIDFKTCIDWKEEEVLLKAAFPVDIHSTRATYDIQYGNIERNTHWNTSWDMGKFEVYGHKWADLSEDGYGVSLMNDCKYGYDIKDHVMRLTLLKSGTYPHPDSDKEYHEFVYSLYPHADGWREARTVNMAYNLNVPMYAKIEEPHDGVLNNGISMIKVDKDNVIIEVVKKAEDNEGIIIRLYECYNRRENVCLTFFKDIFEVWECSLLEDKQEEINVTGNSFSFKINPYEIKTFLLKIK